MAMIGYARCSTVGQDLTAQLQLLKAAGCDRIYQEKITGTKLDRPELTAMLDYVREGDTVITSKIDRIARSTKDLLGIVEGLEAKKVNFKVLNINLDTATATGKMMLTMLAAIGQFEVEMMKERQIEGIAIAKAKGVYKGRKPTAQAQSAKVLELLSQGKTKQAVADLVGIGIASVYRIAKEDKK